jgi:hypothetical protein
MSWRPMLLIVGSLALTACATPKGELDPTLTPGIGGRDVLFAADLVHSHAPTVYEAILEVRPDFFDRQLSFDARGRRLPTRVFVDGTDKGDIDALRTLPIGPVTSIRYVEPGDAEFRWAHGTTGAVIVVTTAR